MDLRDDGLIDISSFLEESISPILERPTKRHATAMPVVITDYPIVTEFEADWGALKNQDVSLEKSSSSASSADPLVVAAAQAELDEALINESKAKLELATRLANKAKHKIELVKSKSASKSSTRSRSIHRGTAPILDGKSNDNMSQITATRDIRDDLSDLLGLDMSGMDKIPEENLQETEADVFDNINQSAPQVQFGPQPPTVPEVPQRVESQPAEVPKTVPRLDERTLQAFTREQDAQLEQHRRKLDEEAERNACLLYTSPSPRD